MTMRAASAWTCQPPLPTDMATGIINVQNRPSDATYPARSNLQLSPRLAHLAPAVYIAANVALGAVA